MNEPVRAPTSAARPARRPSELPSLRARVRKLLIVTFVIIGVVAVLTAASFRALIEARSAALYEIDPAALETSALRANFIDQENSVRGYFLSRGEESFLQPYEEALAESAPIHDELEHLLRNHPNLVAQAHSVQGSIERWRTEYAEPTLQAVAAAEIDSRRDANLERGSELFDQARAELEALEAALQTERSRAVRDLDTATYALLVAVATLAAMSMAVKAVLWRTYHRAVGQPLDQLGEDATAVASGELQHVISSPDHAEFAELGLAMEEMRQRLVEDLNTLEEAHTALVEQATELERSNSDLEQFAYVASHDLQEPLRKIISFCQLLQNRYGGQLDERADQYINYAVDGARRMQVLINDLLTFSRVGRHSSDHTSVDLNDVVDQARSNLSTAIEESGAVVEHGALPTVQGDVGLLVSLFQNLIANAVKFRRPEVPPAIDIRAEREPEGWAIRVSDNGIGIEPEFEERVFVIFQRLHGKEAYAGTGIGLAMCRKIVEHHGGSIEIEETTEPGTRFLIKFPDRPERPIP